MEFDKNIKKDQIVRIEFSIAEAKIINRLAKETSIGGKSSIYADQEKRQSLLRESEFTGQLGEAALYKFFFGEKGFEIYQNIRKNKNQDKYSGDGGRDIPDFNIDIKCSRWKDKGKSPLEYHLWVRETEYHKDTIYILALTRREDKTYAVYLIGYACSEDLALDSKGRFSISAYRLRPMEKKWIKTKHI